MAKTAEKETHAIGTPHPTKAGWTWQEKVHPVRWVKWSGWLPADPDEARPIVDAGFESLLKEQLDAARVEP